MSRLLPVWHATADLEAFPGLSGHDTCEVVVVGGGVIGLTTAHMLQRRGARVVLLEARRIGAGTSGGTTGKVTSQHGLVYADLLARHGPRRAAIYAEANQWAVGRIAELAAEMAAETSADCELRRAPAYLYTLDAAEAGRLRSEYEAAVGLGLPASLVEDTDLPFDVALALRFEDQAHLHPLRYLHGLARAFLAAGGRILEGTRVTSVHERDQQVTVRGESGSITAQWAVLATLAPVEDRGAFFARQRAVRAYGIALRLRDDAPEGMHITLGSPTRSTRPLVDREDWRGLIVVGESHRTGDAAAASPARWGALERWAREHFRVESVTHRWSAQDLTTGDGLPFVGRSPRSERVLVATGMRKWGLTNGTAAALMLSELVAGSEHPWLEAYDSTRLGGFAAVPELVSDNLVVGRRFVADNVARVLAPGAPVESLAAGTAARVRLHGRTVGAHRDAGGDLEAVSLTCTHLGCVVNWNAAERSWDCPCHGSRFDREGRVLDGPAVRGLRRPG